MSSAKDNSQNVVTTNIPNVNKHTKIYPVPEREKFEFEITIKILQTSRSNRNKLTLSRDVLETIIGRVTSLEYLEDNTNITSTEEEHCENEYYIRAIGLINVLCYHVLSMYDKVNSTNTSGIWDVSKNNIFKMPTIILLYC